MSNNKKREGGFYASKVRQFLNEYGGENLEEFCKMERVSYSKMCNCLGRPSYRKPAPAAKQSKPVQAVPVLPELELKPLVIDAPIQQVAEQPDQLQTLPVKPTAVANRNKELLRDVCLQVEGRFKICIGNCPVSTLVTLIKEMEVRLC